jgi:hypothetical protein
MANISRTVTYKTMSCLPQNFKKLAVALQKNRFREGKDVGISKFADQGNYLSGILIAKVPVFLRSFDLDKLTVVRVADQQYDAVAFGLDYDYGTLEVFASKAKLKLVESFLFDISEGIGFGELQIDVGRFVNLLEKRAVPFSLTSMRIRDFQFEQNLRGTFAPKILETSSGLRLMRKFKENITMVGIKAQLEGKDVLLRLSPDGSVTYSCDEGNKQLVEVQLKRLFVEKKRLLE